MLLLLNAYPRAQASEPAAWELKHSDDEDAALLALWWCLWLA